MQIIKIEIESFFSRKYKLVLLSIVTFISLC